jgi:dTMP kinase
VKEKKRGRFVVFEGLDCSGSSTQANLLYERLISVGRRAWLTSEPSSGPFGQLIRLFFSGRVVLPPDREIRDQQFAFAFAADRFDHLHNPTNGVIKHLSEGVDVICTRYVLSSMAYNVETLKEEEVVRRLNDGFPEPDFLIYLDCPVELSLKRMDAARATRDTYENVTKLTAVYENYHRAVHEYSGRKLLVDASLSREHIADLVFDFTSQATKLQPASFDFAASRFDVAGSPSSDQPIGASKATTTP